MRSKEKVKQELEDRKAKVYGEACGGRTDYVSHGWIEALEWILRGRCPSSPP